MSSISFSTSRSAWMHRYSQWLTLLACLTTVSSAGADELVFNADRLLENAITRDVRTGAAGVAVELDRGILIEDDGPAAGYTYRPNEERVSGDVWIRKDLIISDPRAEAATLLIGGSGTLSAIVNGRPVKLEGTAKAGNYWRAFPLPVETLRAGKNEITLHGSGKVWIARDEDYAAGSQDRKRHPNRSARSTDAGRTWDYDNLGPDGRIDGEYYIRLFLDRYEPRGSLVLPVVDTGNLAGRPIADPIAAVPPVRVSMDADAKATGAVIVRTRTGLTPSPGKEWTPWAELAADGFVKEPAGRFMQVSVEMSTADPLATPTLTKVAIEATPTSAGDWPRRLRVTSAHNEQIVRSSIPFEHEPFDHPRLKELRRQHKLDSVVSGAKDEFELICRLAEWSSKQWTRGHLSQAYPAWDALEILKPHADGTTVGGFCQQYNLVLLQACQSFGIPGRAVSLSPGSLVDKPRRSGHEVVELWSNQYRKWVYVDGEFAWYAVDGHTKVPLSLWELRLRQLQALKVVHPQDPPPVTRIVKLSQRSAEKNDWTGLDTSVPFAELRLIPRSNFLESAAPLPLNQGMRGWFWTGHVAWTDASLPAAMLYGNRVSNKSNWEWTLNQAHYTLEATATPGELKVHLDTETPGFATFVAAIDGGKPHPARSGFIWKLHPGRNRLAVHPRNIAGIDGITSFIEIEQP